MGRKHALVVGASGLLGSNFLRHLSRRDDWETTSLSRRPPDAALAARHLSLDLLDRAACLDVLASLPDIVSARPRFDLRFEGEFAHVLTGQKKYLTRSRRSRF